MKKKISIVLAFSLLLSLCACSSQKNIEKKYSNGELMGSSLAGEGGGRLFAPDPVALPDVEINLRSAVRAGEQILIYGMSADDTSRLYLMDISDKKIVPVQSFEKGYNVSIDGTQDGMFLVTSIEEDGTYTLTYVNPDGTTEAATAEFPQELCEAGILGVHFDPNGYVVETPGEVHALEMNGKYIKLIKAYNSSAQVIRSADDALYIVSGAETETVFEKIGHIQSSPKDDEEYKNSVFVITDTKKFPIEYMEYFDGGYAGNLFAYASDMVYEVDMQSGRTQEYANTFASRMGFGFIYLGPDKCFAFYDNLPAIWSVANNEGTIALTLAMCSSADDVKSHALREAVSSFNAMSASYRIDIVDYGTQNTIDGNNIGMTRLTTDIIAGNVPDIYDLWSISSTTCAAHGLLQDLYPFLDSDAELSRSDLVNSIIDTLTYQGCLYEITPSFSVNTVYASPDTVDVGAWSVNEFLELGKKYGNKSVFGSCRTRDEFLMDVVSYTGRAYIDKETATCNFNHAEFMAMLEFSSALPDTKDQTASFVENIYYGEQLLYQSADPNIVKDLLCADGVFQSEVESVGFPTPVGHGVSMAPSLRLGMSASSDNQEGVWEFFRYLLSDAYQYYVSDLPVTQKALNVVLSRWVEEEKEPRKYGILSFRDGQRVQSSFYAPAADEHTIPRVLAIIESVDSISEYDPAVYEIIFSEVQALWAGKQTVEEVANNIQSRASIYVSEQYG